MALTGFSRIGFIGLGAMGKHMAEQLALKLPEDSRIFVFDVATPPVDELVGKYHGKVVACTSPREVAQKSEYIISMVPEGLHVASVYLDPSNGITTIDLQDRILIDCSTIDIATSLKVKQHITEKFPSASFYDAPVSGGVLGAAKGTIAFFLSCAENDPMLEALEKLLSLMGKQIIPCGKPSLVPRALNMGIKAGLDPRVLSNVFAAGTVQNAICDRFNPCPGVVPNAPSSKGYEGGFKVQLMKKDFSLAVNLASSVGATLKLGNQGLETYEAASNDPQCFDKDSRVVFRYIGGDENWAEKFKN